MSRNTDAVVAPLWCAVEGEALQRRTVAIASAGGPLDVCIAIFDVG